MDDKCPWCGEQLTDPFTGDAVTEKTYDRALEAHVEECQPWLEENGLT